MGEARSKIETEISDVENSLEKRLSESAPQQIGLDHTVSVDSESPSTDWKSEELDLVVQIDNLTEQQAQLTHNRKA